MSTPAVIEVCRTAVQIGVCRSEVAALREAQHAVVAEAEGADSGVDRTTRKEEAGMSSQVYTMISPTFRRLEKPNENLPKKIAGSLRYLLQRLVGCHHRQLSRPFTHDGRTYRSCASCGMRREFDLSTWQLKGRYYQPEVSKIDRLD